MDIKRPHVGHAIKVDFLPTPPIPERSAVLNERRRYSRQLAEAALMLKERDNIANTDPLTGLGNRRMLNEKLPQLFNFAEQHNLPIALAFADVRGLKRTNDNDGHEKGDELLKASAEAFSEILRDGDIAIHLSGDEFVAVLVGYAPTDGQNRAELDHSTIGRLTDRFGEAAQAHGIPAERSVGIDVAITTAEAGDTPDSLLSRAETMMRMQKKSFYKGLEAEGTTFQDRRIA